METAYMTTLLMLFSIVAFSRGEGNGNYPCTIFWLAFIFLVKKNYNIGTSFGYTALKERLQLFTQGRCLADE